MSNNKNTDPIVPPMESDPALKEYRCPHCGRFLFKGNVKKLNMLCHHCHKMIIEDESEFINPEIDAI